MTQLHHDVLIVPRTHPALPGHFPGRPVVPGVLLLSEVLRLARCHWPDLARADAVAGLTQAKFLSVALPEQGLDLTLNRADQTLTFELQRAGEAVCRGTWRLGL